MESKVFELRAPATLMVLIATKVSSTNEAERYLLSRSGFGKNNISFEKYIYVYPVDGGEGFATTDPFKHGITELRVVHDYIKKHFDTLEAGEVLDYDFIVGNTNKPKTPERLERNWDYD